MNDNYFSSLVLYYGRSRFYYSMQKVALDGLAKYPMQSKFRFFNGMALVLGNTYLQEGIRELSPLRNEPDFELAATMALIYAHKCCRIVDQDALLIQERRLNDARNSTNPTSYYYAALFLYLRSEIDLARKYADKATKIDANFDLAVVLKAWCDLSSIQPMTGNMQQILESCITHSDGKNIDASLALVRFYQTRGNFEEAVLTLNKISVRYPELNIPLIEKMETHLAARHWDHAMETSMRVINLDPNNIAALRVKCIILIGRESNFKPAVSTLQQLLTAVERIESGNHSLILQICRLFSKICSRNADILQITLRYVDKINEISPGNLDILTELGYQRLLQNNLTGAEAAFRAASNINGSNFNAVCGMTLCKIKAQRDDKDIQYIKQQLAFLNDLCGNEKVPIILYMSALLPGQGQETSVQLLIQAFERHVQVLQASLVGVNYINLLNPDFLLELTVELLRHRPIPISLKTKTDLCFELSHHETLNITLKHCRSILEIITHVFPGHMQALYMIAKIEFFCGEFTNAIWRLKNILHINEMYTDARLLLAEVFVQENQMPEALHSLELALSHNFAVRERPMYHLLLGIIQRHHQLSEAHQSFLNAMQLIGDRPIEQYGEHNPQCQTFNENTFTKSDKMTLYLELIYTLRDIGDAQSVYESERLLQTAMDEFSGTAEEGRLIIVHADIMLQKYNVSKAISLLSAIKPSHPYFLQAKTNLANVHLVHRKDRAAFSKCFTELVQARPEPESYLMLGDAYMSIQEAELAINAYQNAFSMNKNNSILASKLGRAFVKTHQYSSALKYYHEAIQNPGCSSLKLDLAELYLKLKQYQNAIDALTAGARNKSLNDDNVLELQLWTKQLLLLARVYEKSGNADESLQTLKEARDNQYRLQKRFSIDADQSETLFEQYKLLSKICLRMAQHLINKRDKEQECVKCIEECLKYASNDPKVLVPLARLYMQLNLVESCREMCLQILQIDSNNEDASVMMADLSFRKMEFDNAAYHFSQLLISQPCYWTALARLIEVMRRSGSLVDALPFLQRAEYATANSLNCLGLNYCRGLYEWYCGNPNGALRQFNKARRDQEWGQKAILLMIEICINPDGEIPNGNDLHQDVSDSGEFNESRLIALRTAERLLKELRPRSPGIDNHRLLRNFIQMASKQKLQVESALQDLMELTQREEYQLTVAPVYALASTLIQLKQIQKAKNHLKRIARMSWNFDDAEYLERSWLLLADIYIHANKLDVAESLVGRVLDHNKSSTKAFELAGLIAEKAQSYATAAKHYYQAWNFGGRSKPQIGYKLAYNYMKMKNFASAINVCQQVLKSHPDYIVIRKEILEKCQNNVRT